VGWIRGRGASIDAMRRRTTLREQLREVPIFSSLADDELARVARLARRIREPAGELLAKEGEPGHELLVILEGEVDVRRGDDLVATLGPGDFVGEVALLDDPPRRTATVRARTAVTIAFLGRLEFERLCAELPQLAQQVQATRDRRRDRPDPATT
jgi:CRP/FNR family cyclic AMP-dependent transcriptional regulator